MQEQNANDGAHYVVVRPFSAGGCDWKAGQIFNPAICTARTLRLLRDQRKILKDGDSLKPMSRARAKWLGINWSSTLSQEPSSIRQPKRKIKPDTEWNGDEAHIYFKHSGKGKYRVFEGEIALTAPMKKADAEAEAAKIIAERLAQKAAADQKTASPDAV